MKTKSTFFLAAIVGIVCSNKMMSITNMEVEIPTFAAYNGPSYHSSYTQRSLASKQTEEDAIAKSFHEYTGFIDQIAHHVNAKSILQTQLDAEKVKDQEERSASTITSLEQTISAVDLEISKLQQEVTNFDITLVEKDPGFLSHQAKYNALINVEQSSQANQTAELNEGDNNQEIKLPAASVIKPESALLVSGDPAAPPAQQQQEIIMSDEELIMKNLKVENQDTHSNIISSPHDGNIFSYLIAEGHLSEEYATDVYKQADILAEIINKYKGSLDQYILVSSAKEKQALIDYCREQENARLAESSAAAKIAQMQKTFETSLAEVQTKFSTKIDELTSALAAKDDDDKDDDEDDKDDDDKDDNDKDDNDDEETLSKAELKKLRAKVSPEVNTLFSYERQRWESIFSDYSRTMQAERELDRLRTDRIADELAYNRELTYSLLSDFSGGHSRTARSSVFGRRFSRSGGFRHGSIFLDDDNVDLYYGSPLQRRMIERGSFNFLDGDYSLSYEPRIERNREMDLFFDNYDYESERRPYFSRSTASDDESFDFYINKESI